MAVGDAPLVLLAVWREEGCLSQSDRFLVNMFEQVVPYFPVAIFDCLHILGGSFCKVGVSDHVVGVAEHVVGVAEYTVGVADHIEGVTDHSVGEAGQVVAETDSTVDFANH